MVPNGTLPVTNTTSLKGLLSDFWVCKESSKDLLQEERNREEKMADPYRRFSAADRGIQALIFFFLLKHYHKHLSHMV